MRFLIPGILVPLLGGSLLLPVAAAAWHHPLYLGNDGYWRQRVRVDVHNAGPNAAGGAPVAVQVGGGAGEANLVGAAGEAVRVVRSDGVEVLFAIYGPDGLPTIKGPIAARSQLVIPAECTAGGEATYYVYFDNPSAWATPDFLQSAMGLRNGGVESGSGGTPYGWTPDPADSQHQVSWITESPHSGLRCLKTVVAPGAPPTWISTRQSGISIVPGARYVLRAWVKAENVAGYAGWYVHIGNAANPMLLNQVLSAGDGTYDWKEVTFEFTAPAEADRADIGTVLWGTGTGWYDDVSLECSSPPALTATATQVESISVTESGNGAAWYDDNARDVHWDYRAAIRVFNLSDTASTGGLVQADITPIVTRLGARSNGDSIRVADGAALVPSHQLGNTVCFPADLPPRTVHTYYVYLSTDKRITPPRSSSRGYEGLLASDRNLVQNPGFELATRPASEQGADIPDKWVAHAPPAGFQGFGLPGLYGARAAKMQIPAEVALNWYGWSQDVPVRPGKSYLLSAWVKTRDVRDGSVQLNAHYRNAAGELCQSRQYASAGTPLTGTHDWTLMTGSFDMPADCVTFQVHLTMLAHGEVWHDGVVVVEVQSASADSLEKRPGGAPPGLSVWPVNAIVKVFQDDPMPDSIPVARITAARNEKEPLQLAVRSTEAIGEVSVSVLPPTDPQGRQLSDISVAVVGYVPIDHATGYYRSEAPSWVRKYPTETGQSDGWAGLWPDPLLPQSSFPLKPDSTQPVWITVSVPKSAPPGDYVGRVRFLSSRTVLKEVPFTVHVWDFQLPDERHLPAIYDVRLGSLWETPGRSQEQETWQVQEFMAAYRVCPDAIQPDPAITYENGTAKADFAAFDRAAERYFSELKMPHTYTPSCFYLFGWGMPPREVFGEAPYEGEYPYRGADPSVLRPAYKQAYQAALRVYWNHMKEKGWADKVVLYISDEPFYSDARIIAQMKALCDMVHEVDPAIPIYASTWAYVPEWKGYLNVWGIGHYGIVSPEQMARIRANGDRLRYTTDGHMCTDTPYAAVERLLPHYCFQYDVEGYEFWGFTWLTYDPYEFGWHAYIEQSDQPGTVYWVRYPNGDGYLCYPGGPVAGRPPTASRGNGASRVRPPVGQAGPVSTIRLEQAREGAEDYEYLRLLTEAVAGAHAARGCAATRAGRANRDAGAGEAALARAAALVPIPNAGGLHSTAILPDPDRVLAAKEAVAKAIEMLRAGLRSNPRTGSRSSEVPTPPK
jgi:hypothetical protein